MVRQTDYAKLKAARAESLRLTPDEAAFLCAVGWRIRACRLGIGWNQQNLADAAGVSRATVGRLETGADRSSVYLMRRVALGLGATLALVVDVDVPLDVVAFLQSRQERGLPSPRLQVGRPSV